MMGKISWKTFREVPKANIYNMDEVSTETSKHLKKIIGSKDNLGRAFQITPKGDGQMSFYITMYVSTCADGLYKVLIEKLEGAPPPMIIPLERNDKN